MDTGVLVKEAKRGGKEALLQLVMAQKDDYYRLAYTYTGNSDDAMDSMEDMIVILYENIYKLKKEEAFYSWSKTILVNCCRKLLRKRKKVLLLEEPREAADGGGLEHKDQQLVLEKHMAQLSEGCREVLRLRFYMDYDYQTIADITKIPLGTVKSRISIGLKKLRESLGGELL